jgi:hypothetical protein
MTTTNINSRSRAYWAKRIKAAHLNSVKAILAIGKLLLAAKDKLNHGEFQKMIEHDLPFSVRTGQRLMAIAADRRIAKLVANATRVSLLLPASWGTLYELTRCSDEQFEKAISDGTINPGMSREDVEHILGPSHAVEEKPRKPSLVEVQVREAEPKRVMVPHLVVTHGPMSHPTPVYVKPSEELDYVQRSFDNLILSLIRTIEEEEPSRFAKTTINQADLSELAAFLGRLLSILKAAA